MALLVWTVACGNDQASAIRRVAEREALLAEIGRLQASVERTPEDLATLVRLATQQRTAGQYDDAQRSFERALQMSGDSDVARELATLLYRRGRYLQAASVARRWRVTGLDGSDLSWLSDLTYLVDSSKSAPGAAGTLVQDEQQRGVMVNSIGMKLVSVPGGSFDRGQTSGDADQRPVRSVAVSPFLIGQYEVTVAQFKMFVSETGYRRVAQTNEAFQGVPDEYPAYRIAWLDAQSFTIWLSARERATYRLPTEAEWEFAARGRQGNREPWGNEQGRPQIDGNWGRTGMDELQAATPPLRSVGSFPRDRSPFGLFDMAGNVREWCLDDYDATYYAWSPEREPFGPVNSTGVKVLRGGAWNHPGPSAFALTRSKAALNQSYTGYGFRVVREP